MSIVRCLISHKPLHTESNFQSTYKCLPEVGSITQFNPKDNLSSGCVMCFPGRSELRNFLVRGNRLNSSKTARKLLCFETQKMSRCKLHPKGKKLNEVYIKPLDLTLQLKRKT